MLRNRGGFTLSEVLVALVITGVIGAAATSALVTQTKFFDRQEKIGESRGVSQGAVNIMLSELRMIEPSDSGLVAANDSMITVNVPIGMGIVCGNAGVLTVYRAPIDPSVLADSGYSGYAWRNAAGAYTYVQTSTYPAAGTSSVCSTNRVSPTSLGTGSQVISLSPTAAGALPGFVVLLYQKIRYTLKPSTIVPGKVGLYRRNMRRSVEEEIVAPFDTSARFRFYISDAATPADAPPNPLRNVTGLELVLNSVSERQDTNGTYPVTTFKTSVFFKNR